MPLHTNTYTLIHTLREIDSFIRVTCVPLKSKGIYSLCLHADMSKANPLLYAITILNTLIGRTQENRHMCFSICIYAYIDRYKYVYTYMNIYTCVRACMR